MSLTKVYTALKRMRELSSDGVPFSFSYQTYSEQRGATNGHNHIAKAMLRTGISRKKSDKSDILIAYHDLDKDTYGTAYLPLISTFNGIKLL